MLRYTTTIKTVDELEKKFPALFSDSFKASDRKASSGSLKVTERCVPARRSRKRRSFGQADGVDVLRTTWF